MAAWKIDWEGRLWKEEVSRKWKLATSVRGCGRIRKEKEKGFQRAADTRHRSMNEPSEAVEVRHFNGN